MVSEVNQTKKDKYFIISLTYITKTKQQWKKPTKLIEKEVRGQGLVKELEEGGSKGFKNNMYMGCNI